MTHLLSPVAEQVLEQLQADIAGLAVVHGVELDDGPLVAVRVPLHSGQPHQAMLIFVDVELVVGLEGSQRHAEEAEDADGVSTHRQAQRTDPRVDLIRGCVRQTRELTDRGKVSQARRADPARARAHSSGPMRQLIVCRPRGA